MKRRMVWIGLLACIVSLLGMLGCSNKEQTEVPGGPQGKARLHAGMSGGSASGNHNTGAKLTE